MFKKILLLTAGIIILLMPVNIFAEDNDLTEDEAKAGEKSAIENSGEIKTGAQQIWNNDSNSSKFNEYRDIKDGFYLYKLNMEGVDTETGRYFEFRGTNVNRNDQNLKLRVGKPGRWGIEVEWDEIPHLLSNKAQTPYNYQGSGLYTVPGNAGVSSVTTASTANDILIRDNVINKYLHSTDLGTQREKGRAALTYTPISELKFKVEYSDERKEGTQVTGAPIGNRPPRSLNVQLSEPVDYQTRDLKFEAEYADDSAQIQFSYLLSEFENDVQSLTWQSLFYGNDADGSTLYNNDLGRTLSTYGRTALYPDNRYQNATLSLGFNLPLESRLAATASYGLMEQDADLLPYSYSTLTTDWNSTSKLPRTKADAEMNTMLYNVDYTINPIDRLNLRAFYRYYNLDNNTGTDQWYYVTSDAANETDGTQFTNKRKNVAYAYNKQNYGLDAYHSIWRTTLGLGYERENIDRDFREANTEENMFKASVNYRPINWLALRVKYLHGEREADNYNYRATDASYWYTQAEYTANKDNALYNYANPPDLRKYDVSDRERDQWNVSAMLMPLDELGFNISYMNRKDDYASGVSPTTITGYVGTTAQTPYTTVGQQLGLLENEANVYTAGANYTATQSLKFSANYSREEYESKQRGNGASEDNKYNGTGWTDPARLWTATTTDKTDTYGVGAGYVIIPEKLNFVADYTYSYGKVNIDYEGYGNDTATGNYYYFSDPEAVSHRQHTLNASLEYQMLKGWTVGLSYLYDRYKVKDWLQASNSWMEEVGSEYFLRDSYSGDYTRWGNRLVSMGSYLGPSYESHVGFITLAYKW